MYLATKLCFNLVINVINAKHCTASLHQTLRPASWRCSHVNRLHSLFQWNVEAMQGFIQLIEGSASLVHRSIVRLWLYVHVLRLHDTPSHIFLSRRSEFHSRNAMGEIRGTKGGHSPLLSDAVLFDMNHCLLLHLARGTHDSNHFILSIQQSRFVNSRWLKKQHKISFIQPATELVRIESFVLLFQLYKWTT